MGTGLGAPGQNDIVEVSAIVGKKNRAKHEPVEIERRKGSAPSTSIGRHSDVSARAAHRGTFEYLRAHGAVETFRPETGAFVHRKGHPPWRHCRSAHYARCRRPHRYRLQSAFDRRPPATEIQDGAVEVDRMFAHGLMESGFKLHWIRTSLSWLPRSGTTPRSLSAASWCD